MTSTTVEVNRGGRARALVHRQLPRYPDNGPRAFYLGVVVLSTIVLYYELYVGGSVATQIAAHFHMSLRYLITVSVVANAAGALASLAAGLADRWGRSNLVAFGLLGTGALTAFGLPHAGGKGVYLVLAALVGVVEGMALVATPALIRDFSPQLGRASAMGFWTLGPVLGSLVVTEVSSHTLSSHHDWRFQFYVAGIVGLVVWALAMLAMRELAPAIRDQLMVSLRDRALVEARATGIDPDKAMVGSWRQMLTPSIVGPAFAISVFLIFYYVMVGFIVVYFATTYGYSPGRANALGNWYWIANAFALVAVGVASDRLKVRKPFMLVGALGSAAGIAYFATLATRPHTGYYTFAWTFVLIAVTGGIAYCAWMAAFTETVERRNPAATAHGLAVWGWIIRTVVVVSLVVFMFVVTAASTLVDHGPTVSALAAKYRTQLATLQKVDAGTRAALSASPNNPAAQAKAVSEISGVAVPDIVRTEALAAQYKTQLATAQAVGVPTLQALAANPTSTTLQQTAISAIVANLGVSLPAAIGRLTALASVPRGALLFLFTTGEQVQRAGTALTAAAAVPKADLAYLQKYGAKTQKAVKDSPKQWRTWWWVCFGGQLLFLPFIFLLAGRWSPRRAREDALEHAASVQREMAAMGMAVPEQRAAATSESRPVTARSGGHRRA
jgi:MFS family permease